MCCLFLDQVPETIAKDYKSYVAPEMWLNLILDRLRQGYYRSSDQLWYDFDLIPFCSKTYNGPNDDLTTTAETMVDKIRKELRVYINVNKDSKQVPLTNNMTSSGAQFGFGLNGEESLEQNCSQENQKLEELVQKSNQNTIKLTLDKDDIPKSDIDMVNLKNDGKIVLNFEENNSGGVQYVSNA